MPRNYKKKKENVYSELQLNAAIIEVTQGNMTVGRASKYFKVPKETLRRQCKFGQPAQLGSGRPAVLSAQEESHIAAGLDYLGRCGFPQGREQVKVCNI